MALSAIDFHVVPPVGFGRSYRITVIDRLDVCIRLT